MGLQPCLQLVCSQPSTLASTLLSAAGGLNLPPTLPPTPPPTHATQVRVLINCPASQGAIGDLFNFHLGENLWDAGCLRVCCPGCWYGVRVVREEEES